MNLLFTGFLRDEYVDEQRDGDNQMEHKQRPSSSKPAQSLILPIIYRSVILPTILGSRRLNDFPAGLWKLRLKYG